MRKACVLATYGIHVPLRLEIMRVSKLPAEGETSAKTWRGETNIPNQREEFDLEKYNHLFSH